MTITVREAEVEIKLKVMTLSKNIAKQLPMTYSIKADDEIEVMGVLRIEQDGMQMLLVTVNHVPTLIRPERMYPTVICENGICYHCENTCNEEGRYTPTKRHMIQRIFLV